MAGLYDTELQAILFVCECLLTAGLCVCGGFVLWMLSCGHLPGGSCIPHDKVVDAVRSWFQTVAGDTGLDAYPRI